MYTCITSDNKQKRHHKKARKGPLVLPSFVCRRVNVSSPLQRKSFFCTSGTLSPLMWAGAMHWVKGAKPRLALSQSESQDRWQSQCRLFECRRLKRRKKVIRVIITFSCQTDTCATLLQFKHGLGSKQMLCPFYLMVMW